jgi:transcriptional regulator with XRE-family HTH domain
MAEEVSPTVARRHLRLALREAREHAGKTQQDVAEQMEWSQSKVIRIENGDVTIAPNDLRPLLTYLGVTDRNVIASLTATAKIARRRQRQAWYQRPEFREHLTGPMMRLIEYEAEAVALRSWSIFYIPGPLQTPDYARANLSSFDDDDISEQQRHYRAEARRLRREVVLRRLGTLQIYALLDESVFRRPLGGPGVFLEQLRDMHRLAAEGLINVRMVPFDFDAAVTNNATFDLLSLDEDDEGSEVLYREVGLGDEIIEDRATTRRHHARFDKIWHDATSEQDTIEFMGGRISDLEALIERRKNPE